MLVGLICLSLRGEELRKELQKLYRDHRSTTYEKARWNMYNDVDCFEDKILRLYSTDIAQQCHTSKEIPEGKVTNAEHIVPQSLFKKAEPYVSDLHHLYSSGSPENNLRSNYPFGEFDYSKCSTWIFNEKKQNNKPSDPENWNCLSSSLKQFMPIKRDRGIIARAVLYFITVYPEIDIGSVKDIKLFVKWNKEYPPTIRELYRNDMVNITQGNRNPYTDNPNLVDLVFGE